MGPPAENLPLVSCIMPTSDRRRFVPAALACFDRQDYPRRELIVVDDGSDPVGDLMPADASVRYVRLDRRASVGAKRNLAIERAEGDLIAHWDDDDWHSPRRLSVQVEAIRRGGSDLCGLTTLLFLDNRSGRAWRYTYPAGLRPWLSGSSMLYTRGYWSGHRFEPIDIGEDARFVAAADPARIVVLDDSTIHVGMIHGQNAAPKPTSGAWWRPYPADEVARLIADGRAEVAPPKPIRNVFACLVHEDPECVADLVRNLRHLDPDSTVLLYNGGRDPHLLDSAEGMGAVRHPSPRPMRWGRLHDFAVDCMRFARAAIPFDALTIVDSDQLLLRPGYSNRLAEFLAGEDRVGMLGNSPSVQTPATTIPPAKVAHAEAELWRPFLGRFPDGPSKFVHWTFWPSTVFTADAASALVDLFDGDEMLKGLLARTEVWATEEVLLPTLVALLGYRIVLSPFSYDFVKYRTPYTVPQLDSALNRPDIAWAHPVPRRLDDPLRKHVRARFGGYSLPDEGGAHLDAPTLLRPLAILARMRAVEGWLDDEEADLLLGATVRALVELPGAGAVVEVGSYRGRATVVLGSVVRAVRPEARVWSIDPHDGKLGAAGRYVLKDGSAEALRANLAGAGVLGSVEIVRASAPEVDWSGGPVALLLVDGLHDREAVAADFGHFDPHVPAGGYVAFHDYAGYFPDVVAFVDELIAARRYDRVDQAGSLIVLRKNDGPKADPTPAPVAAAIMARPFIATRS